MGNGYVEPLYLEPCYQQQIAFGKDGFPFTYPGYKGKVNYQPGICTVTERMFYKELMYTNICHAGTGQDELDSVVAAFIKVYEKRGDLA